MEWLVFTYSLPTGPSSSPRVALWRRLRRQGAITVSGVHLLPAREECREALQWLAQEVRQAQGEALILDVTRVEGLSDAEAIELFRAARRKDYAELEEQTMALTQQIATDREGRKAALDTLERLRRRFAEIRQVDYFAAPEGGQLAAQLDRLGAALAPPAPSPVPPAARAAYQGRRWATRPRPHVDRLACAWLIRRFIDPQAAISYTLSPAPDEVTFDMAGGAFTHAGDLCAFETMIRAFALDDPALRVLAAIVHTIDLRDGQAAHPETAGIARVLEGWLQLDVADAERERWGIALFEGLYGGLQAGAP